MIGPILFWLAASLIAYTYVLFPVLVVVRARLRPRPFTSDDIEPELTVLVAAHNEEDYIEGCIESLLNVDYPEGRLRIAVASDGSTDGTEDLVRKYGDQGVQLLTGPRCGKAQALNQKLPTIRSDFVVFTDANIHFKPDALRALIRPFADPTVGGVAGNPLYTRDLKKSLTADGECAFWDFERVMKICQSKAGHVTSANGAIYAIRRNLFRTIPPGTSDDFMISAGVIVQGSRLVFAPKAQAVEPVVVKAKTEFRRKVRLVTVGLYSVWSLRELLNPLRYGFYAWQLAWQKVLRRLMVIPLIMLWCVSPWVWAHGPFYQACVVGQAAFYAIALLGFVLRNSRVGEAKLITLPFYFCMVNLAALVAVCDLLRGKRVEVWAPTRGTE